MCPLVVLFGAGWELRGGHSVTKSFEFARKLWREAERVDQKFVNLLAHRRCGG